MELVCIIILVLASVPQFQCQSDNSTVENGNSTVENENSTIGVSTDTIDHQSENSTVSSNDTIIVYEPIGIKGLYGGSYYNYEASNPENIHYIHGTYQSPIPNYYIRAGYYLEKDTNKTFDYYLGYGISKMTDEDFQYKDFHYFYHDINRTVEQNGAIPSDYVISCHPNATSLCPENTETICLMNGTMYCMSKISVVEPCPYNESFGCVSTTVPCVVACVEVVNNFENVTLPCLADVVIVDVYEDGKGKTLSRVSGTFVIVDALTESERTFCVTVVVDPKPKLD